MPLYVLHDHSEVSKVLARMKSSTAHIACWMRDGCTKRTWEVCGVVCKVWKRHRLIP